MRVTVSEIPDGLPGTLETLRAIFQAIQRGQLDPAIVKFTRQAIGSLDFRQERQIIDRITRAWTKRIQIIEDPIAADWLQEAGVTLTERRGDCDDLVIALGSSLESVGFPIELIVGSTRPGGVEEFNHVWLRTWLPNARRWLSIDPRGIIDRKIGFRIGQELRPDSLTAIGAYGFDPGTGTLIDGVSVASRVTPRRRNFLMPRIRGSAKQTAQLRGVAGCVGIKAHGLGNPNAPVETFITAGSASAQGQTVQPVVNVTTPTAIQERIVLLQSQAAALQTQRDVAALGPEAVEKAARSENIQKRLAPWVAGAGIAFALTGIARNLSS